MWLKNFHSQPFPSTASTNSLKISRIQQFATKLQCFKISQNRGRNSMEFFSRNRILEKGSCIKKRGRENTQNGKKQRTAKLARITFVFRHHFEQSCPPHFKGDLATRERKRVVQNVFVERTRKRGRTCTENVKNCETSAQSVRIFKKLKKTDCGSEAAHPEQRISENGVASNRATN